MAWDSCARAPRPPPDGSTRSGLVQSALALQGLSFSRYFRPGGLGWGGWKGGSAARQRGVRRRHATFPEGCARPLLPAHLLNERVKGSSQFGHGASRPQSPGLCPDAQGGSKSKGRNKRVRWESRHGVVAAVRKNGLTDPACSPGTAVGESEGCRRGGGLAAKIRGRPCCPGPWGGRRGSEDSSVYALPG